MENVTYVDLRQDERDGDERDPHDGGQGHGIRESAEVEGPTDKLVAIYHAQGDWDGLETDEKRPTSRCEYGRRKCRGQW